ncbi:hypothetical protein NDU88_002809 [Pleurodeles waltl]|uniref:Uncharacterized protein n=1 Tax=Pleurodeles waltl TaxID=8319 RepID=A0AAV7Q746_PLEWA|nr:hypothetical protein NDU88_002809 [Pleurodeles waltl]
MGGYQKGAEEEKQIGKPEPEVSLRSSKQRRFKREEKTSKETLEQPNPDEEKEQCRKWYQRFSDHFQNHVEVAETATEAEQSQNICTVNSPKDSHGGTRGGCSLKLGPKVSISS